MADMDFRRMMALEPHGPDTYVASGPQYPWGGLYGGHIVAQALRAGTWRQASPSLAGCTLYASGHPCPMCLAALLMAGCGQVFYAFDNQDATPYGLSNEGWYRCLRLPLVPPPLPLSRLDTGISAAQLYGDAPWPPA